MGECFLLLADRKNEKGGEKAMRAEVRIDKIIVRAAISTFAAAVMLIAILFGVLALAFPQTMMDLTYSLGMDKACVNYAITSYARFDAVEYIAKGADTALAAQMYDKADKCLEYLVSDEDFDKFCEQKNQTVVDGLSDVDYRGYYLRQLCVAKYRAGKGKDAVDRACGLLNGSFAAGNPLVAVLAEARIDQGKGLPTVQYAYEKMTGVLSGEEYANYSEADKAYFQQIYTTIQTWLVTPLA